MMACESVHSFVSALIFLRRSLPVSQRSSFYGALFRCLQIDPIVISAKLINAVIPLNPKFLCHLQMLIFPVPFQLETSPTGTVALSAPQFVRVILAPGRANLLRIMMNLQLQYVLSHSMKICHAKQSLPMKLVFFMVTSHSVR